MTRKIEHALRAMAEVQPNVTVASEALIGVLNAIEDERSASAKVSEELARQVSLASAWEHMYRATSEANDRLVGKLIKVIELSEKD